MIFHRKVEKSCHTHKLLLHMQTCLQLIGHSVISLSPPPTQSLLSPLFHPSLPCPPPSSLSPPPTLQNLEETVENLQDLVDVHQVPGFESRPAQEINAAAYITSNHTRASIYIYISKWRKNRALYATLACTKQSQIIKLTLDQRFYMFIQWKHFLLLQKKIIIIINNGSFGRH